MTAAATQDVFVEFVRRYYHDPVLMVREVLGGEPDADQARVLNWAAAGERRISIRSGHGVGKTTTLAWAILWHALTRYPQITLCTAPSSGQLFDALAAQTKAWFKKLPQALQDLYEIQVEGIYLKAAPDESFVSFATSKAETPEALAGKHSEHMLIIPDEASGIPEPVFEAAAGSMSGLHAVTILAGNPVRTSGLFFDSHHKLRDLWRTVHISCVGHPRVSPDFIEDMKRRYGQDSNAYRVRVLGEFPTGDDDTIIPFSLIEASLARDVTPLQVKPVWGVDCARFGNDASAICKRQGNSLLEKTDIRQGYDTMQVVGWVKSQWDTTLPSQRPSEILVDSIGIGAGVCDRLVELKLPARGINVAETGALSEQYPNLRSELWFRGYDWFNQKDSNLRGDDALAAELSGQRFRYMSNGKRQAYTKDEMRKLGFPSPNRADAFLLTLASENVSAVGGKPPMAWNEPLKRKIAGIV